MSLVVNVLYVRAMDYGRQCVCLFCILCGDPDEWIDALCLASRATCMSFVPGVYFLAVINVTPLLEYWYMYLRIHCACKHPTMVLAPPSHAPTQEYGWPGHTRASNDRGFIKRSWRERDQGRDAARHRYCKSSATHRTLSQP